MPEPCTPAEDGTMQLVNNLEDERQIRVSVYFYTRSLKKNRGKYYLIILFNSKIRQGKVNLDIN